MATTVPVDAKNVQKTFREFPFPAALLLAKTFHQTRSLLTRATIFDKI
jgi:hypothetical protein